MAIPNNQCRRPLPAHGAFSTCVLLLVALLLSTNAKAQSISISDALDDSLVWTTSTNDLSWVGQTNISHDGISALQVGPPSSNRQAYYPTLTTTVTGPATVSLWSKVNSPGSYVNTQLILDSQLTVDRYGTFDWTNDSVVISYGNHTLTFAAAFNLVAGATVWLDSVQVTPLTGVAPTITTQPASQTVWPHNAVTFSAQATGTPPLSYQWYVNGELLWGATQPTLTLTDPTFTAPITYSVVVTNLFGSVTSSPAVLTIRAASLYDSLDATNMIWGDASTGFPHWFGQTNITFDGEDAAESYIPSNHQYDHVLEATVEGPARFTYRASVGHEAFYLPHLVLTLDGTEVKSYTATWPTWGQDSIDVPFGTHQLQWRHDASGHVWLDQFSLIPLTGDVPTILSQPQSITANGGDFFAHLSIDVSNCEPSAIHWFFNNQEVGSARSLDFYFISPAQAGSYVAVASNLFGMVTSQVATVTVDTSAVPLGEALNATNLVWLTSPAYPFFAETGNSHDGFYGVQWPGTDQAWMATFVTGPGLLSFWTRRLDPIYSGFFVSDNRVSHEFTNATLNWEQHKLPISAGTHVLQFQVLQPFSVVGPWIDEVKFTPGKFAAPKVVSTRDGVAPAGGTATLRVIATSALPMTYEWKNPAGYPIYGGTDGTLLLDDVGGVDLPGVYTCVVKNDVGTTTATARLVLQTSLTKILGTAATEWSEYSLTAGPWVPEIDRTHGAVMRSPKLGDYDFSSMWAEMAGPGTLYFWWKVSSQPDDLFTCDVDFNTQATISGETGWRLQSVRLPAGHTTVTWTYEKHSATSRGMDRAWLGRMKFVPDVPSTVHIVAQNPAPFEGERTVLKAATTGTAPFTYRWHLNGRSINNATNSSVVLDPVTMAAAGSYSVTVYGPSDVDQTAGVQASTLLTVRPAIVGQRVMAGYSGRLVLNTRPPATASFSWTNSNGRVRDGNGGHGSSTRVLTIDAASITNSDLYSATARTSSGWHFTGAGALFPKKRGTVVGWGFDHLNHEISVPEDLDDVVSVSMDMINGVALLGNGTVKLLGISQQTVPDDWTNIVAAAAGYNFTIALRSNGTVAATQPDFYTPALPAEGVSNVVAIAASGGHWIALKGDGTVVGWNVGWEPLSEIIFPPGLTNVTAISAGQYFDLALKADGTVVAWGDNYYGELVPPATLRNIKAIAAGSYHGLALRTDGTVVAWGFNAYGQATVPAGLKNVVAIAAGDTHSAALKSDGTVVTWGGYLGYNGAIGLATVPIGVRNVSAISAGMRSTFALTYSPQFVSNLTVQVLTNGHALVMPNVRGRQPMSYQWRLNGRNISGATDAQLQITQPTNTASASQMKYDVVVHNNFGTSTSSPADLPINWPPFSGGGFGAQQGGSGNRPPFSDPPPTPPTTNTTGSGTGFEFITLLGNQPPPTVSTGLLLGRSGQWLLLRCPVGGVIESTDDLSRGFSAETNHTFINGSLIMAVPIEGRQRFYRVRP
jgi:hypothetical protein